MSVNAEKWGHYALRGWRASWLRVCHSIGNRRLALWARKVLKSQLSGWVDVEVWGLRLRVRAEGNLSEQRLLLIPQHLDRREREFLAEEMKGGGLFLDVGANAGVYSLWLASRNVEGVCIEAFEPDSELCRSLRFNLEENKLAAVKLNEHALGAEEGQFVLMKGEGNLGKNEVVREGVGHQVLVRPLLDCLREKGHSEICVMKIDIEGHEPEVLLPFFEKAERELWPKWVICEDLDAGEASDGAKVLVANGYTLAERTRMNGIFRRND